MGIVLKTFCIFSEIVSKLILAGPYTEKYRYKAEEDLEEDNGGESIIIGGVHHPDSVVINDFYFKTGA
jgi:hypothetical protein